MNHAGDLIGVRGITPSPGGLLDKSWIVHCHQTPVIDTMEGKQQQLLFEYVDFAFANPAFHLCRVAVQHDIRKKVTGKDMHLRSHVIVVRGSRCADPPHPKVNNRIVQPPLGHQCVDIIPIDDDGVLPKSIS